MPAGLLPRWLLPGKTERFCSIKRLTGGGDKGDTKEMEGEGKETVQLDTCIALGRASVRRRWGWCYPHAESEPWRALFPMRRCGAVLW